MDENPNEVQPEATTPDEELDLNVELDGTEDADALKQKLEDAQKKLEQFSHVVARAKKAEEENKELKSKLTPPPSTQETSPQPSVEETVLLAQGMSEDLIAELKLRAPKYGGSLIKAQADPLFVAVKEKLEKDTKDKEASLPASRGSGSPKPKKDFNTPGISREEHKAMVMKELGQG